MKGKLRYKDIAIGANNRHIFKFDIFTFNNIASTL
jgi:hypothetical protein